MQIDSLDQGAHPVEEHRNLYCKSGRQARREQLQPRLGSVVSWRQ